jgi:hypothetical protein
MLASSVSNEEMSCCGAKVMKIFTVVNYEFFKWAKAFVPSKPFHLSLMFAGKAGAYPSEAMSVIPEL